MPRGLETKFVPFEEWLPDRASLASGAITVRNVLSTADGYEVSPGFVPAFHPAPPATPYLTQAFTLPSGVISTLLFTKQRIYRLEATGWVDVTRASGVYNTLDNGWWSVAQWGDIVYATNGIDKVQKFVLSAAGSPTFVDVNMKAGGFRAKHLIIVRDFLVGLHTNDDTGVNDNPYGISWSGRLRPEDMTPSLATQANYRDVVDIGPIVGGVGGDFGLILGETGMVTLDYVGPPITFQISKKESDVGCELRGTIIKVAEVTYWYSKKGWRASAGGPSQPIGATKIDTYFKRRHDPQYGHLISAVGMSDKPVILWSYVTTDSVNKKPDALLFFNTALQKFSEGEYALGALGTAATPELYLDDPITGDTFIDSVEGYVDDTGEAVPVIVGVAADGSFLQMSATADQAYVETREIELIKGMRARVLRVRLVAEGASEAYEARVSGRDKQPTPGLARDPWLRPERTGSCAADKRGRYHRFGFKVPGTTSNILGADVTFGPAGDK